ncbi:unnamed protein product [Adineta ricciae]|uniref:Uncharacterized protein n=1 Tax=Adineta ricciae TaxID=249248 RepID=A0A814L6P8_ADIRI|nr:unnamed protein product [Adineta ricciae]
MAPLRLKVQLGDEKKGSRTRPLLRKFVYAIDSSSNQTIAELSQTLQDYVAKQFSHANLEIVHLMTDDGFILSKSDLCSHVLKDNDRIICVDMRRFIDDYHTCIHESNTWLERKQYDITVSRERILRIGLNSTPELFVRLFGTVEVNTLYVFGIHELIAIANRREPNKLISRIDQTMEFEPASSSDWFIECKWDYEQDSNTSLFIVCNFKVSSSDEVWSAKLQLILDHSRQRIEKGQLILLSGESGDGSTLTNQQRQRIKELAAKLPPPIRTGPQIACSAPQTLKLTKHECEGDSLVRMANGNTNAVLPEQSESSTPGMFLQHFTITHIVFSKKPIILPEILNQKRSQAVDKPITVAHVSVLYQMHDGGWKECQDIAIGNAGSREIEINWLPHLIINIEPDKLLSYSIRGSMLIKGICGQSHMTYGRFHKSLPQPLKLKIVVTDNHDKHCSLIVEQLNAPLQLVTSESVKESSWHIKEHLYFTYADDCENAERYFINMFIDKDDRLVLGCLGGNKESLDRKKFLTMEFNAKQTKVHEIPLNDLTYTKESNEIKVTILLDPVTYISYAIRFEIKTLTSRTEETVLIPIDKIL